MITDKETLDEINKMNAKLIYEKGFLAGKSQATKEILEEELRFLDRKDVLNQMTSMDLNREVKLKQQLQKLGEDNTQRKKDKDDTQNVTLSGGTNHGQRKKIEDGCKTVQEDTHAEKEKKSYKDILDEVMGK